MHFVARVRVAGRFGCGDASGENSTSVRDFSEAREQLAELKIAGDVAGIVGQELAKVILGCGVVADFRAFESEAVAREGVLRICVDESFETFAARLGCLGHESKSVS